MLSGATRGFDSNLRAQIKPTHPTAGFHRRLAFFPPAATLESSPKASDGILPPALGTKRRGAASHRCALHAPAAPADRKEIMRNVKEYKSWLDTHPSVLLLMDLIRIYIGIALFFKGIYFMQHREELLKLMNDAGSSWFAPAVVAHYIIPAHLFGGLMLTLGLLTRFAAAAQLPILLGAVFYVHMPKFSLMIVEGAQRQSLELAALVLFLTVLVFIHGPGRLSLDYAIRKAQKEELTEPGAAG
jgi:uncharacterized membrane protein YphA (DoxX/SURF4 family)